MNLSPLLYGLVMLYTVSVIVISIRHARARKAIFCPRRRLTGFGRLLLRSAEGIYLLTQPLTRLRQALHRHALSLR